jgi:hypothetical protein
MRMVQMTVHQVVHMIAVRNRFVTASGPMLVARIVARALVLRRAFVRVVWTHFQDMFVHMVAVRPVKVAVVQIIHMVVVFNGHVPAAGAMDVLMMFVNLMLVRHKSALLTMTYALPWAAPLNNSSIEGYSSSPGPSSEIPLTA